VVELAGFFNVENFASLIVPALRAGAVGHLFLVTVGTFGKAVSFQSIMGAPGGSALLGVSPFWIRHLKFLLAAFRLPPKIGSVKIPILSNKARQGWGTLVSGAGF
jgi:hypothetical protein